MPGLSPPTRGNHLDGAAKPTAIGSIPAHAGEPSRPSATILPPAVYPRPRGGTISVNHRGRRGIGLSPPTRGNQTAVGKSTSVGRSIPAHAGEPGRFVRRPTRIAVYPRPRGGTSDVQPSDRKRCGLSPPTRGNHYRHDFPCGRWRSIPAHAGEPCAPTRGGRSARVYPRPRGGTPLPYIERVASSGLSPPTRGNHKVAGVRGRLVRSIPAHAGEPASAPDRITTSSVYPRPRGGTYRRERSRRP